MEARRAAQAKKQHLNPEDTVFDQAKFAHRAGGASATEAAAAASASALPPSHLGAFVLAEQEGFGSSAVALQEEQQGSVSSVVALQVAKRAAAWQYHVGAPARHVNGDATSDSNYEAARSQAQAKAKKLLEKEQKAAVAKKKKADLRRDRMQLTNRSPCKRKLAELGPRPTIAELNEKKRFTAEEIKGMILDQGYEPRGQSKLLRRW
eukprot:SAG11_NODE_9087_length_945_cov_0.947991_1_plen_207_part_00